LWLQQRNVYNFGKYRLGERQPQKEEIFDYLGWLSLISTLEESLVETSGSIKVWVMDPSLFDV
jgi:hypothetical protein